MTKRRTEDWLTRCLRSHAEIRQFIRYFKWADAQPADSLSSKGAPATVPVAVGLRGSVAPTMELSEPRGWPVGWTWQ
jgi:hypothetical protein